MGHAILHEKWYNMKCTDPANERKRIVETAESIIREDIRLSVYDCDTYPSSTVITQGDGLVPDTLKCFVKGVIRHKGHKQASVPMRCTAISHALIAACRPRSFILPLLLAIGIYLHRKYASCELIDILNSLGFAVSYREVQRYEYSMIAGESLSYDLDGFLQLIFYNGDFNVHSQVPRIRNIPPDTTLESFGNVPIKTYNAPTVPALKSITIKDATLPSDNDPGLQSVNALNYLWLIGYHIKASSCPSWSGFMQEALKCGVYDISRVVVLTFINLDPNNLSTIYSTLHFAQHLGEKYGISLCPVTFDQHLYVKAAGFVAGSTDLKKVFIRLGGFHLLMVPLETSWQDVALRNCVNRYMARLQGYI